MDPYLEGALWGSAHAQLIAEIARQLAPRLRPRYIARVEKRFVMDVPDLNETVGITLPSLPQATVYPDVGVVEVERGSVGPTMDVAVSSAPLQMATLITEQSPQTSVEIRDVADHRLVVVIELLSPTNKRGDGREEYVARRQRFLQSSSHLLEIDLLRGGQRVPMRQSLPDFPYFVFLSRAGRRPTTEVWPIALTQSLPTVPVPLLPGDADVPLELQRALDTLYDLLGYDLEIDYRRPPQPPLSANEAHWAAERIREKQFK
jgi:hypothetical protein